MVIKKQRLKKMMINGFIMAMSIFLVITLITPGKAKALGVVNGVSSNKESTSFEDGFSKDESKYEIYPVPHSIEYLDEDEFSLQKKVNIVLGDLVDDYTQNFLLDILDEYNIAYDITDTIDETTNNIIINVNSDNENHPVLNKIDAYILDITDENIKIEGKDTDSAYYGVATLQMIFSSFANKKLVPVKIEDWAEMQYRGVIEGFYGTWDHEERISLMKSSRDVKMNTMVYAAKGDKYHREWWNRLYPQDRLDEMEELAKIGEETKVKFAWAIHLEHFFKGGVSIDGTPEEYEKRYNQLIAKFNQLYDVGIRRFDIMNDDFGSGSDADVVKLMNRIMTDFVDEKGDVEPIIFTPQGYNVAWAGDGSELRELSNLDPRVKIYWTGRDVNSPIEQGSIDRFYELTSDKLEPVFWLNYPVNEHSKAGIFLGEISHYARDGVTGLAGAVTNPSWFAETNKVAIFQLASLFWNNQNYSKYADELWENSFKYLQPEVYDSYLTIARNVANAPNSSRVDGFPESEYIKKELTEVLNKIKSNESIKDLAEVEKLLQEFEEILFSVEDFRKNVDNDGLKNELEPWLKSLVDVVTASKEALQGVTALEENNYSVALNSLLAAKDAISTWDSNQIFPGDGVVAKAGTKRLYPFAQDMIETLEDNIETAEIPANLLIGFYLENLEPLANSKDYTETSLNNYKEKLFNLFLNRSKDMTTEEARNLMNTVDDAYMVLEKINYNLSMEHIESLNAPAQSGEEFKNAFDGNTSTIWHTPWGGNHIGEPATIVLNAPTRINEFEYIPRPDGPNGRIKSGTLEITDKNDEVYKFEFSDWENTNSAKIIEFGEIIHAKKIVLIPTETYGHQLNRFVSAAALNFKRVEDAERPETIDYEEINKALDSISTVKDLETKSPFLLQVLAIAPELEKYDLLTSERATEIIAEVNALLEGEDSEDPEETEEEAKRAAVFVSRTIYRLPNVRVLTVEDAELVETVRAAYEKLSDQAKTYVTTLGNLELRENRLAALSAEDEEVADEFAVRELQRRIYRLPSARVLTKDDAKQVKAIRADYDGLNAASKGIFSPQYLKNLELREAKIEELEKNNGQRS